MGQKYREKYAPKGLNKTLLANRERSYMRGAVLTILEKNRTIF